MDSSWKFVHGSCKLMLETKNYKEGAKNFKQRELFKYSRESFRDLPFASNFAGTIFRITIAGNFLQESLLNQKWHFLFS